MGQRTLHLASVCQLSLLSDPEPCTTQIQSDWQSFRLKSLVLDGRKNLVQLVRPTGPLFMQVALRMLEEGGSRGLRGVRASGNAFSQSFAWGVSLFRRADYRGCMKGARTQRGRIHLPPFSLCRGGEKGRKKSRVCRDFSSCPKTCSSNNSISIILPHAAWNIISAAQIIMPACK